ncbi:hypothetical protein FNF28_00877 [Cafeteria roenbergensis]|uniref:Uncharacterized protein n=1 Tax=Cafeteria roenbergensis TaxID=33653 RepID=A0A5A8E0S5_CAFRO|nr:hypothetical protein FNF28_00877 [Cafeteria roenbergensis]
MPTTDDEAALFSQFVRSQTAEAEARLFEIDPAREQVSRQRRVSFSEAARIVASDPRRLAQEANAATAHFMESVRRWADKGWLYDPGQRRFVQQMRGVDPEPAAPFFLHRPLPFGEAATAAALPPFSRGDPGRPTSEWELLLLHPDTQSQPTSMEILKGNLARRFAGAAAQCVWVIRAGNPEEATAAADATAGEPRRHRPVAVHAVAVVGAAAAAARGATAGAEAGGDIAPVAGLASAAEAASQPGAQAGARPAPDVVEVSARSAAPRPGEADAASLAEPTLGHRVNRCFDAAIEGGADLVLLDCGDAFELGLPQTPLTVDDWLPVYPCVLDPGTLLFTPSQLEQLNGVDGSAATPADVANSLLTRSASTIGAVLVAKGVQPPRSPASAEVSWHRSGLSSVRAGMLSDGRVSLLRPCIGRHAPPAAHGWLSQDTHAGLLAAIRETRPECILELGSWYGKSTRAIRRAAPGSTIIAVDWFKNNARLDWPMKRLGPADKLFLNHPRFETFAANMLATEAALQGQARPAAAPASSAACAAGTDAGPADGAAAEPADGAALRSEPGSLGRTFLMQADAHDAVRIAARLIEADPSVPEPSIVFIDCEKKSAPLEALLKAVHKCFPRAVVVGDDLVYPSVQAVAARQPPGRCLSLSESYTLLPPDASPEVSERFKAALLRARDDLRPPAHQALMWRQLEKDQAALLLDWTDACAAAQTPLAFADGGTALHDLCRRRNTKQLHQLWPRLFSAGQEWTPPLVNAAQLTPWDYLANRMPFFS